MENNELFKTLLFNSANFLLDRIENRNNHVMFTDTINYILNDVYFDSLEDMTIFLEDKLYFLEQEIVPWWRFNKRENEYELKAFEVAIDVSKSLTKRFITGGEGERNILVYK